MTGKKPHGFLWAFLISLFTLLAVAAVLGIWFAVTTALLALGASAARAVIAFRTKHPQASRVWRTAAFGQLAAGAVAAGLLFGAYLWAYSYTQSFCQAAGRAPTLAERQARLAEMDKVAWLKTLMENLTNKGEFVFDCDRQRLELEALIRDGICPTYLLVDVECRCGDDAHATAKRCPEPQLTVCGYGGTWREISCEDP